MKRLVFVILLGLVILPGTIKASGNGYFVFSSGLELSQEEIKAPVYFSDIGVRAKTHSGFLLQGAGGLYLSDNLRAECEISYRARDLKNFEVDYVNVVGIGLDGGDGDIRCFSAMANAWYDLLLGEKFIPYIGGGIGAARVSLNNFSINTFPIVPGPTSTETELVDDDDIQFAYQIGAGVGYELSERFIIDLGYRYFATLDPEFTDKGGNKVKIDNAYHNLLLGIKYRF